MKRMVMVLALAACTGGPQVVGPASPDLAATLRPDRPEDGCWHQIPTGWFETPCPDAVDKAALGRALTARGLDRGGVLEWQTRYGLESEVLSLEGARAMGLVPTPY